MSDQDGLKTGSGGGNAGSEIENSEMLTTERGGNGTLETNELETPELFDKKSADRSPQTEEEETDNEEGKKEKDEAESEKGSDELSLDELFDPERQDELLDTLLGPDENEVAKNAKAAVKAATQRNQAVADERRALETEKQQIFSEMQQMRNELTQLRQQIASPAPGVGYNPQAAAGGEFDFDVNEMSPAAMQHIRALQTEVGQMREMLGLMNLDINTRTTDGQLAQRYPDYDPSTVDKVIAEMDQGQLREVVYKARKLDSMDIDALLEQARREGAEKILRHFRELKKKQEEIRDPIMPKGKGAGNKRAGKPKNFEEARARASEYQIFD